MKTRTSIMIIFLTIPLNMFCQKNPSQDIRGWNILFEDDMSVFNDNVWQKDNFVTRGTGENEEPQIYMLLIGDGQTSETKQMVLTK